MVNKNYIKEQPHKRTCGYIAILNAQKWCGHTKTSYKDNLDNYGCNIHRMNRKDFLKDASDESDINSALEY